jgi:hypothetical protein
MRATSSFTLLATLLLGSAPLLAGADLGPALEGPLQGTQEKKEAPVFVRAPIGAQAALLDAEGARVGLFKDHVIDRLSGRITKCAVEIQAEGEAARTVALSFADLTWNALEHRLELHGTLESLVARPEFDAEKAHGRGQPIGAGLEGDELPKQLLASEIVSAACTVGEEEIGRIGDLLVNPKFGTVAFALVRSVSRPDEAPLLVPWSKMVWTASELQENRTGESRISFALSLSPDMLDAAPRLDRGDPRSLDAKTLERVLAFWGMSIEKDGMRKD